MGCKCTGSGDALTQSKLGSFIQEGGCGPKNLLVPAIPNGEGYGEGLKVSGVNVNHRGTRTQLRSRDRFGQLETIGFQESPPDDNQITLEWARPGCGGKSLSELQECEYDIVVGEFCCDSDRYDAGNATSQLRFRAILPSGSSYSDLSTYDDADERISVSQSATMGDPERTYSLEFTNMTSALSPAGDIAGITFVDGSNCTSGGRCRDVKRGCGEVWYAITDAGTIVYNAPDAGLNESDALAGFSFDDVAGGLNIQYLNDVLYVSATNAAATTQIFTVPVLNTFVPDVDNATLTVASNNYRGLSVCGNRLFAYGHTGAESVVSTISASGSETVVFTGSAGDGIIIHDMECCGATAIISGSNGFIGKVDDCDLVTTFDSTPTANTIPGVAVRESGETWLGEGSNVWWTASDGAIYTPANITITGNFLDAVWASPCVGYILSVDGSSTYVYTTTNGGADWSNGDRMDSSIGSPTISAGAVGLPCCGNAHRQANTLTVVNTGVYTAAIEQC